MTPRLSQLYILRPQFRGRLRLEIGAKHIGSLAGFPPASAVLLQLPEQADTIGRASMNALRLLFPGHDCQTARFGGLAGLKNGRLVEAAEAAGFKVLREPNERLE